LANLRRITLIAILLLVPNATAAQRVASGFVDAAVTLNGRLYRYQIYIPQAYSKSARRWPVILFLHGAVEGGTDGRNQTTVGLGAALRRFPDHYPALVIMPQAPPGTPWSAWPSELALATLDHTLANYRADSSRVYLTGISMGATGAWQLASRAPGRFAAIAPISGFITVSSRRVWRRATPADSVAALAELGRRLKRLPAWIFHGEVDPIVTVRESRRAAQALRAAGGNVRYTEYAGLGHEAWDTTYNSAQFQQWLFAQRRASPSR
jgi:predicted peptidase